MAALVVHHASTSLPAWWMLLSALLLIGLMPTVDWLFKSPQRRRLALTFLAVVIIVGVGAVVEATVVCPGCFDDCCPDYLPYGICWPIGWWGC